MYADAMAYMYVYKVSGNITEIFMWGLPGMFEPEPSPAKNNPKQFVYMREFSNYVLEQVSGMAFSGRSIKESWAYFFDCYRMRAERFDYVEKTDTVKTGPILLQPPFHWDWKPYTWTTGAWSSSLRIPPYQTPVYMTIDGDEYLWIAVYERNRVRTDSAMIIIRRVDCCSILFFNFRFIDLQASKRNGLLRSGGSSGKKITIHMLIHTKHPIIY